MGNITATLKKFLGNKNTVTILAILAGVIVLWYFYNYRVNQAITTITIPYAVEHIDAGKKIEMDNIAYKEITQTTTKDSDIITDMTYLEGKYVCHGTSIPKNGFLYKAQVCEEKDLKNSIFDRIPDNNRIYALAVNSQTTYANSIMEGTRIDLYAEGTDDSNQRFYGKLIESIEVLEVRDSSGKNVFWDSDAGDSAFLLFAVPEDLANFLESSEMVPGLTVTPVPRSSSYTQQPGDTKISNQDLYEYIRNKIALYVD